LPSIGQNFHLALRHPALVFPGHPQSSELA
jgi:hypothetical protein